MKLSMNDVLVLSTLSGEDRYGLDIIKEVSAAGTKLYLGGLYTILRRLEKQKLIKGYYREETEDRGGNRRRYYRILAAGEQALGEAREALLTLWGIRPLEGAIISRDMFFIITSILFGITNSMSEDLSIPFIGVTFGNISGSIIVSMIGGILGVFFYLFLLSRIFKGDKDFDSLKESFRLKQQKASTRSSSFLKNKLKSLRFLLPQKYREEIMGDLIETKNTLRKEGHGKGWTFLILLFQFVGIVYSMLGFKLSEVVEKKMTAKEKVAGTMALEEEAEGLELDPLAPLRDQKKT